uniref:Uncharacterized protein n=1 Tax=Marseillevirus LCMAC101 TaxID=2506602 RepID=A0A481YUJ0_9VIRU|nr:MAG: hypothetical protein LCMAC101_07890 [Marseillevirus LCMAC101]
MFIEIPGSNPGRAEVLYYILTHCRPGCSHCEEPWEWRHSHNTNFQTPFFLDTLGDIYTEFMELVTTVEHPDPPHIVLRFTDGDFVLSIEKYPDADDYEKDVVNSYIISQEEAMEYLHGMKDSYLCNNIGLMVPIIYSIMHG